MFQNLIRQPWLIGLAWFLAAAICLMLAQSIAHVIKGQVTHGIDLGIRIHNPLDIRPVPLPGRWDGQIGIYETDDAAFAAFEDYAHGLRAGAVLLRNYGRLHQITSLVGPGGIEAQDGVITRWSPEFDHNNTQAYADRVARLTGFGSHQTLNLEDGATVAALIRAMTRVELGLSDTEALPYTEDDLQRALTLANF